jgi:carbon storage regulator CsrA
MLYAVPRVGESIEVCTDVVITVVSVGNGEVRLGVTAPRDFSVELEESTNRDSTAEQFTR